MSGATMLLCSSMAPRRVAFRGGVFFLLRRGGVAEYDASWLFLGPSDRLASAASTATGCASYCGGEFDALLVASVEFELESEPEEEVENCWSSS